jgi:hypothetical protein
MHQDLFERDNIARPFRTRLRDDAERPLSEFLLEERVIR